MDILQTFLIALFSTHPNEVSYGPKLKDISDYHTNDNKVSF